MTNPVYFQMSPSIVQRDRSRVLPLETVASSSQTLVVDFGPGMRAILFQGEVPDAVEVGLLNANPDAGLLIEVTPAGPRPVLDLAMKRTRMRSNVSRARFEGVEVAVEYAGLFDLDGSLRCFGRLFPQRDGTAAVPFWTVLVAPMRGQPLPASAG